jgi:hypothetical protein
MKTLPYSKENISFARLLRKNMTKEEKSNLSVSLR